MNNKLTALKKHLDNIKYLICFAGEYFSEFKNSFSPETETEKDIFKIIELNNNTLLSDLYGSYETVNQIYDSILNDDYLQLSEVTGNYSDSLCIEKGGG